MRRAFRTLLAAALLAAGPFAARAAGDLHLEIHAPADGSVLSAAESPVEVVGAASIYGGVKALDLFLVVDSSQSLRRTDPRDYRKAGIAQLVRSLPARANIHLGVVDFDRKATLLSPLTDDREQVVAALGALDQDGETDIARGIDLALQGFAERGRPGATRVILLFTDGKSDEEDALEASAKARRRGVAIHALRLGAEDEGEALLRAVAEGTGGSFVPVTNPARLPEAFRDLRTTGIDRVDLRVNGGAAVPATLAGGTFSGRVPLRAGANRIEVVARSLSGRVKSRSIEVGRTGALSLEIESPAEGVVLEDAADGAVVAGRVSTLGPLAGRFPGVDPGIGVREVALHVDGAPPIPAPLVRGRFEVPVPLAEGENAIIVTAIADDGTTARERVTVRVAPRAPGCAELTVDARRGGEPALSISDRAVEIVLDASNSMWGRMHGQPKISVAKRMLRDALVWLPEDLALSLRVYGHRSPHERRDCSDSELLVPVGPGSRSRIRAAIDGFRPRGQTPLAYALERVSGDFSDFRGERAVVLVTDGIESCNGDPVAAARRLRQRDDIRVHVIGFGLGSASDEDSGSLRAIARAGGGRFLLARSADELREAMSASVGTAYHVRSGERTVAGGTLGSRDPLRIPPGDYTLALESKPAFEVPLALSPEERTTVLLKREGRQVFQARRRETIPYAACSLPEPSPAAASDEIRWEALPAAP